MDHDRVICSECGLETEKQSTWAIDQKAVCFTCIYGDTKPYRIYPIGKVATHLEPHELEGLPRGAKGVSRVDLLPSQKRFMYKLEEEEFLLIVYYLHKVESIRTIFNRRLDGKRVGVFASRTPYRLSKIAVQTVKLLKVEENVVYVEDLDAMDGSPVLDIKLGLSHAPPLEVQPPANLPKGQKERKWKGIPAS